MTLGQHLRTLRGSRKVPDVARTLGVVRSAVHLWEASTRMPSAVHLQALLDLYEASDDQRLRAWELRARVGQVAC